MNYPFQWGAPQVILFLIVIAGVTLIIWSVVRLFWPGREEVLLEDDYGRKYRRYMRRHRQVGWGKVLSGLVLILIGGFFLGVAFAVQEYLGLTGNIKIATVKAVPDPNQQNAMRVTLVLFDSNGNQISGTGPTTILNGQQNADGTYEVLGNRITLQANVVEFPSWFNFFGVHSGYKLTRMEGQYDNFDLEANAKHTLIVLNGGDDDFFNAAHHNALPVPFAKGYYASGVVLPDNGTTYDIFINQTALVGEPEQ